MPARKSPGPTINDADRYRALRREGASKEKAARIANTPASVAGKRGGKAPPYEDWTKADLYDKAKTLDIDGRSSMSKSELIKALRNG